MVKLVEYAGRLDRAENETAATGQGQDDDDVVDAVVVGAVHCSLRCWAKEVRGKRCTF